jgi:hypothetical protein
MSQIIPISPPITLPATEAKSFDVYFVTELRITDITPKSGTLAFTLTPMNSATGETLPSEAVGIQVPLWDAVGQVPSAASALNAVLDALPKIRDHFA